MPAPDKEENAKMKIVLLIAAVVSFLAPEGYCQDPQQVVGEFSKIYNGGNTQANNLIGGFSLAGLISGFLFGSIGFVAFIYGKKNVEFRPMIIGLSLMVYPYFIRSTIFLYLIGTLLTVALFIFRE